MKKKQIILIAIIVFSTILCCIIYYYNSNNVLTKIDKYLDQENLFHIEKYEDDDYRYILTKSSDEYKRCKRLFRNMEVDKYIGKEIVEYYYDAHGTEYNNKKHENVAYFFATCENEIIGGFIKLVDEGEGIYLTLDHKRFHVNIE